MKTFKQIDMLWQAYCEASTISLGDVEIQYNSCELDKYKVEILVGDKSICLSKDQARRLAEKLYYLTFDEEISPEGQIEVVERANGTKWWYLNGVRHRDDGPAIEKLNGEKHWMRYDKFHREDGPAREWANGDKEWWIDGIKMTEEEFKERTGK